MEEKRDLLLFIKRIINMKDKMLIMQYEGKAMYIPLMLRDSADDIKQQGMKEGMEKAW
ncbi:MAG: hypothetical protein LBJ36_00160 [Synergistaceae bacterium]|jgi:hypothetical protein|nr:hypothetical protein [Synergistaceae bacterium]